VERAV